MGTNDPLMEPLEGYNKVYKELFKKNAEEYFDTLVKKTQIKTLDNKHTVNEYNIKVAKIDALNKLVSKKKGVRGFFIFLMVILAIAAIAFIASAITKLVNLIIGISIPIVSVILFVILLMAIIKKINPKIKSFAEQKTKFEEEAQILLNNAWEQMAPINAIYDWGIPGELINRTIPVIEWDKYFDVKKYQYLHEKFGFEPNNDKNISTYYCLSGSILGNPFLICKDYRQSWIQKQYDGYLTISWTERVRTDNGYKTVTRTQTLHASLTRPAPSYNFETYLVYGNEAAPDLKFYRNPSEINGKNEKQVEKMVRQGSKKLEKKSEKAIINNQGYTKLGNDEFEVLFGGSNRNNEIQYRLLFTPLAQNNLLDLIKNPIPYGDDFYFEKDLKINYIQSKHSQYFDYLANPTTFVHYDCEFAKKNFVEYMEKFFEGFYFDMAPLMSIPLYQQTKTRDFIYNKDFDTNVSTYEHEAMANSFNANYLKPDNADTPSILKTTFTGKVGNADNVNINAYAFDAQKRLTYVSKLGGDGLFHNVPVYWFEYVPVEKQTKMMIEAKNSSRNEFNYFINNGAFSSIINRLSEHDACLYERGLFAVLLNEAISKNDVDSINNVYKENSSIETTIGSEQIAKGIQKEIDEIRAINGSNIEDVERLVNKLNDKNIQSKEVEASDDDIEADDKKLNIEEKKNDIDDEDDSNE